MSQETSAESTRSKYEVQDANAERFAAKLTAVFHECHRILTDNGLLVFTYHHSRNDGWKALAHAILDAGFSAVNRHPVRSEMSVATPKSQAKEPIQLDVIVVCRKTVAVSRRIEIANAVTSARVKLSRLQAAGFRLSRNDRKVVLYGQLLTTLGAPSDADAFSDIVERELADTDPPATAVQECLPLFQVIERSVQPAPWDYRRDCLMRHAATHVVTIIVCLLLIACMFAYIGWMQAYVARWKGAQCDASPEPLFGHPYRKLASRLLVCAARGLAGNRGGFAGVPVPRETRLLMIGGKITSALPSWGRLPTCLFSRKTRTQRQVGNLPHGTYSSADPERLFAAPFIPAAATATRR